MEKLYPALVHKEGGSDYGISFPDFLGCVSAAETQSEILDMAKEALSLHVEGMLEDGDLIPEPSDITKINLDDLDEDLPLVILVPVRLPSKSKRYQVMLPEHLVEEVDLRANNRSAFIAAAIQEKLQHP